MVGECDDIGQQKETSASCTIDVRMSAMIQLMPQVETTRSGPDCLARAILGKGSRLSIGKGDHGPLE